MGRTELAILASAIERELLQIRRVSWYLTQTVRHTFLFTVTNRSRVAISYPMMPSQRQKFLSDDVTHGLPSGRDGQLYFSRHRSCSSSLLPCDILLAGYIFAVFKAQTLRGFSYMILKVVISQLLICGITKIKKTQNFRYRSRSGIPTSLALSFPRNISCY